MKKLILVATILLLTTGMAQAGGGGSVFGTMTTAKARGMGVGNFITGVGLADATSAIGIFTYGLSSSADGSIKLALVDPGGTSDLKLAIGADFKLQVWDVSPASKQPIDLALGGIFEYVDYGGLSIMQVGGQVIGSYPMAVSNGRTLSPYGRFNLRIERINKDNFPGNTTNSNLEFGFTGGVAYEVSSTTSIFGEFQIDGNDGLFLGIDFNIM